MHHQRQLFRLKILDPVQERDVTARQAQCQNPRLGISAHPIKWRVWSVGPRATLMLRQQVLCHRPASADGMPRMQAADNAWRTTKDLADDASVRGISRRTKWLRAV